MEVHEQRRLFDVVVRQPPPLPSPHNMCPKITFKEGQAGWLFILAVNYIFIGITLTVSLTRAVPLIPECANTDPACLCDALAAAANGVAAEISTIGGYWMVFLSLYTSVMLVIISPRTNRFTLAACCLAAGFYGSSIIAYQYHMAGWSLLMMHISRAIFFLVFLLATRMSRPIIMLSLLVAGVALTAAAPWFWSDTVLRWGMVVLPPWRENPRGFVSVLVSTVLYCVLVNAIPCDPYSYVRPMMVIGVLDGTVYVTVWRWLLSGNSNSNKRKDKPSDERKVMNSTEA